MVILVEFVLNVKLEHHLQVELIHVKHVLQELIQQMKQEVALNVKQELIHHLVHQVVFLVQKEHMLWQEQPVVRHAQMNVLPNVELLLDHVMDVMEDMDMMKQHQQINVQNV